MKTGDLVKEGRVEAIGIVVDVFGDLDPGNPWVRVLFTHPVQTYRWCKMSALTVVKEKEGGLTDPPLSSAEIASTSGSL